MTPEVQSVVQNFVVSSGNMSLHLKSNLILVNLSHGMWIKMLQPA